MSRKLLINTATVGGMTLISRILGLLRDMVFARFGVDYGMDAFFVAFKIPNFLRRLFAEGAFSQAFVPVLAEYKARRSHDDLARLVNRVAGTLLGVLSALTVVCVAASPLLVVVFAPGFIDQPAKFDLTAGMLRITFPYLLLVSLVAFAAGILNTFGRFAAAAFAPVWLNVVLIGAALWVAPRLDQPVLALAGGVFVAGIVQVVFLVPALYRIRVIPRPRWGWGDEGVHRILRLMLPGIFGSSVAQINLLFDTLIASFLVTGSVSWLYYSDRLVEFPLGVFAIALSTVILPSLSRSHSENSGREFARTLDWALRWVVLIGVPCMIGLLMLAGPMIATLFQYGEFASIDVRMARLSLMAYTLGLPGFMFVKVLAPAFYARKDVRTPVRIAVIAMLTNMALNILFVVPMAVLGVPGPHAGLAMATSLAAFVNAGLLYRRLRHEGLFAPEPGWGRLLMRIAAASFVLVVVLGWWSIPVGTWGAWSGGERTVKLAQGILLGAAVYLLALRIAGVRIESLWLPDRRRSGRE
jgi:putative peptidoglycan lipid II flippase